MTSNIKPPICWIITEGMAGTENQCLGVAEALGLAPDIKRITLREPWKTLSPYLRFESAPSFTPALQPPWPDLLIASGRKSIAASRYIKRMSEGKTFTVQIQDPRISARHFDLLAVPEHDPTRGENVIVTTATPNRITATKLAVAREEFRAFSALPAPRIAVLIGGTSKAYTLTPTIMESLVARLKKLEGGLMITASRRTGAENEQLLRDSLKDSGHFIWDGQGKNPYFGLLAWADFILVTADSASMLSEAATTGKPVYMVDLEGGTKRLNAMQENLIRSGAVRRFSGTLEEWDYEPLNDSRKIALEIQKRMGL
ncbi:MAG: mitochondrial fission ELM1 family protein [Alphaproteobacteria bacterium]|nr:mitochondrial fission ELM1 family protein [Alphaproteobacteria bacterium]